MVRCGGMLGGTGGTYMYVDNWWWCLKYSPNRVIVVAVRLEVLTNE